MKNLSGDLSSISIEDVKEAVEKVLRLPLLIPDAYEYSSVIERVIKNRINRNLPVDIDGI